LPKKTGYQKLHTFKLPVKANIYDFYVFDNAVFKWEDNGSLAVYNNQGIPVWRSRETFGIGQQYEKKTGIATLTLGKWKIQSRIKPLSNGVVVIEKKPLLGFVNASVLGYRSSNYNYFNGQESELSRMTLQRKWQEKFLIMLLR